ncbi:hypothetical protein A2526_02670 [candidate division WOR-1 bacterium RIFOXYD2_FULL_36_8]|uniref:Uncharacterized protein n=1 Tax=candidate division WOR-1 bacterium RIFOXYB2_FULL_36_35 TaxID=1802578 RepID=A0A1F4S4B2_UNCSA|nr:MAG: hypothetical protein A2230_01065 [candidate division WOR-1 bacterium RIFOXYA2_FULL_36_21]OGC14271.1 MAG: hypothetical protein A2282_06780 [candidate division WOR-1 bacterium RIFOXYA12_FULL_36_13]OGC15276.1 MAG: hypothetical protein A2290_03275 [candidate division WOR-1 bacterium RIFOXYB2_FULL_36_35]OGC41119.1 MAG: hypothetical protein A2526_02670 [candidate division WOR-1 bacterium RIFOXYD2_FULL_36_8]
MITLANIKIDNVTLWESLQKLEEFIVSGKPHLIVTPNPEMIVAAQTDKELFDILNGADLRLPDGISMVVVSRIKKVPLKERVTGIDFLLSSCRLAAEKGWRVFLLGGTELSVSMASQNLKRQFPALNIAGIHDGYFDNDDEILSRIKESKSDIIFAGLGAGKQEKWLCKNLDKLGVKVAVGVGGSFDVISGIKKRAPKWVQKLYIEWLYRLITEPYRIKRQVALPNFLYLTLIKYH